MPELPDVEGFRRYLNRFARGRRVDRVEVRDRSMLRGTSPQALGRALSGNRIGTAERHGKWLLVPVEGPILILHFGMTGLLVWSSAGGPGHQHDRLVLHCEGGTLAYRNMRKLGGVWLARDRDSVEREIGPLGPDAASVERDRLAELLRGRRGGVKALLMDQGALAGVGNLLSDEVLWRARINPRRQASGLSRAEADRLHEALTATIREANPHGRIPAAAGWLTGVRDERGSCPRCGRRVEKGTVAGRTACWCPRCQPPRG